MKKLLLVFLLFWSLAAAAQTPGTAQNYTPISQRYNWLAGYFRALGLPAGCGFPSFTPGQWTGAGAIRMDTCAGKIYFWTGSVWRALIDSVTFATGGVNTTAVDSVYLTPDSLLVARHFNGNKDTIISLVGGGGGANNYPTSITFNTGDGIFTLNRNGLSALTVDLDGRYLVASDTSGKWVNFIFNTAGENTDSLYQFKNGTATLIKVTDRKCGLVPGTGIVTWDSLLVFSVSPAIWYSCIDGTRYTSTQTNITLDPADVTDPRIDAIVLQDGTGPVKVTGTPNSSPSSPQIGANQILLTYVQVNANATTPANVTNALIYDQNVEWTGSATGVTVNFANTTNPFHFTIAADVGAFTNGQSFKFTNASTVDLTEFTTLKFYIWLKSAFANNAQLQLAWLNGSTLVSNTVNLVNGTFGYIRTVTGTYQEIQIPLSSWQLNAAAANTLRITLAGTNANGFYFDYAQLQTGLPQTGQPSIISITGDVTAPASSSILNSTVVGIRNVSIPALSTGFLKYNGSAWVFDAGVGSKLSNDFTKRNDTLFRTTAINVLDYGVIADGTTNNYTALAIIQTWAGSRPLYFPKANGIYLVNPSGTNGLALNPHQRIYGDGDSSRIKTTGNTVLFFLNDFVEIDHLHLIGSGQNAAGVPLQSLILGFEIHSPSIHDNYLEGCAGDASNIRYGGAISFCDVNDVSPNYMGAKIYANVIVDNTVGIYLSHNGEYCTVIGNIINSNTTGVWLTGGNNTINGNNCNENGTNIKITNDTNSGHNTITGNSFNHASTYSVYIDGLTQGQTFTNCKFYYGAASISNSTGIQFIACDILDPGHTVTWTLTNNTKMQIAHSRFPTNTNNVAINVVSGEDFSYLDNPDF